MAHLRLFCSKAMASASLAGLAPVIATVSGWGGSMGGISCVAQGCLHDWI